MASFVRLTPRVPSLDQSTVIPLRTKIYGNPKQHIHEGQFPQTKGVGAGNMKEDIHPEIMFGN